MLTFLILTAPIWITCLSAAVFYKLFSKNTRPEIRHYFSKELFDRHQRDINCEEAMLNLWREELKYNLP